VGHTCSYKTINDRAAHNEILSRVLRHLDFGRKTMVYLEILV